MDVSPPRWFIGIIQSVLKWKRTILTQKGRIINRQNLKKYLQTLHTASTQFCDLPGFYCRTGFGIIHLNEVLIWELVDEKPCRLTLYFKPKFKFSTELLFQFFINTGSEKYFRKKYDNNLYVLFWKGKNNWPWVISCKKSKEGNLNILCVQENKLCVHLFTIYIYIC